jgi:hypothetical protein
MISLPRAISLFGSEISRFVWVDTIVALVFGTTPLLHYDTTTQEKTKLDSCQLEWVYGCPEEFIIFLGRVNAWRPLVHVQGGLAVSNPWREIEAEVKVWDPVIEKSTESWDLVARLAVQECWRHALLIYLYMVGALHVNPCPSIQHDGIYRACAASTPQTPEYGCH